MAVPYQKVYRSLSEIRVRRARVGVGVEGRLLGGLEARFERFKALGDVSELCLELRDTAVECVGGDEEHIKGLALERPARTVARRRRPPRQPQMREHRVAHVKLPRPHHIRPGTNSQKSVTWPECTLRLVHRHVHST